jgi:hypothetical protein
MISLSRDRERCGLRVLWEKAVAKVVNSSDPSDAETSVPLNMWFLTGQSPAQMRSAHATHTSLSR